MMSRAERGNSRQPENVGLIAAVDVTDDLRPRLLAGAAELKAICAHTMAGTRARVEPAEAPLVEFIGCAAFVIDLMHALAADEYLVLPTVEAALVMLTRAVAAAEAADQAAAVAILRGIIGRYADLHAALGAFARLSHTPAVSDRLQ